MATAPSADPNRGTAGRGPASELCILLMVKICFLIVKQQTQGDLFPVQFLLRSIFLSLLHIVATFSGGFRHWQKIVLKAAPAGQQRRALPDLPSDA